MLSLDEAKAVIYDTILRRQETGRPEDTAVIFDEHTIEKPWGWIFFYNNEKFFQTRDYAYQWVGPGPIFFNRNTGETRQFGSGCDLDAAVYDYEMELLAEGGWWCLWLTENQNRQKVIIQLKGLLVITTADAAAMVPRLPHCLFVGTRRHLEWMFEHLQSRNVQCEIRLEKEKDPAPQTFDLPEWMINPSPAQAFHRKWDVGN